MERPTTVAALLAKKALLERAYELARSGDWATLTNISARLG
jgi:hypothetical protein